MAYRAEGARAGSRWIVLTVTFAFLGAGATNGVAEPRALRGSAILQALDDRVITDGVHWRYHLRPGGKLDAIEMGQARVGRWRIKDDLLCLQVNDDKAAEECWEVVGEGATVLFRIDGRLASEISVQTPDRPK